MKKLNLTETETVAVAETVAEKKVKQAYYKYCKQYYDNKRLAEMSLCPICNNPATHPPYCKVHGDFLTKTAPLSIESILFHFSEYQKNEFKAMLVHLINNGYEYEDSSYFARDDNYELGSMFN